MTIIIVNDHAINLDLLSSDELEDLADELETALNTVLEEIEGYDPPEQ